MFIRYVAARGAGGFLFRFVSSGPASAGDALDSGTLSVAQLQNARINWVALPAGAASNPLEAANAAGGTPLDAPSSLFWDARGNRLICCGGFGVLSFTPDGGDPGAAGMAGNQISSQAWARCRPPWPMRAGAC